MPDLTTTHIKCLLEKATPGTPEAYLAQELIRLREHIEDLITAMEDKAATGESQAPAIIAGFLKEIVLGEPNG